MGVAGASFHRSDEKVDGVSGRSAGVSMGVSSSLRCSRSWFIPVSDRRGN